MLVAGKAKVPWLGIGKGHREVGWDRHLVQCAVVMIQAAGAIHSDDDGPITFVGNSSGDQWSQ
jgi:hypothetical protein